MCEFPKSSGFTSHAPSSAHTRTQASPGILFFLEWEKTHIILTSERSEIFVCDCPWSPSWIVEFKFNAQLGVTGLGTGRAGWGGGEERALLVVVVDFCVLPNNMAGKTGFLTLDFYGFASSPLPHDLGGQPTRWKAKHLRICSFKGMLQSQGALGGRKGNKRGKWKAQAAHPWHPSCRHATNNIFYCLQHGLHIFAFCWRRLH